MPERSSLRCAAWTEQLAPTGLREVREAAHGSSDPDLIQLALGVPDPELSPGPLFRAHLACLWQEDPDLLRFGPTFEPLKEQVVALMAARGINCRRQQVLITHGAQQGLNLLARLLLDRGAPVLLEEVAYPGIHKVIEPFETQASYLPTDPATGLDLAMLERRLEEGERRGQRPAFVYVIPDGHNPLGVSLTAEARKRLIDLARRYRVALIEDDPYGAFTYAEDPPPPLRALDDEWVLYVGTFSKVLTPALRIGWLVAPEELIPRLRLIKDLSDLEIANPMQRAIASFSESGELASHIARMRREYRIRRDAMDAALRRFLPPGCRWTRPESGFFFWVDVAREVGPELLQRSLAQRQVSFVPGSAFVRGSDRRAAAFIRLAFSYSDPETIAEGVKRLGELLG